MNVLIVGSGKGSWEMRGRQLGGAIGARVTSDPTAADWDWAELVVLVKHEGRRLADHVHRLGLPLVWDALDCWAQPADNRLTEPAALAQLRAQLDAIRPTLAIGATDAQARALGGVCLPHQGYLGLTPGPVRETCQVVAYDGNPTYLDRWAAPLQRACARRGWKFLSSCPDLRAADLIVALRGGGWDGWMCRQWKSGVKLANAVLAGRPVITQDTAAFRELRPAGMAIEIPADLDAAFDHWGTIGAREQAHREAEARTGEFTLATLAARYHALLQGVVAQEVRC